MMFRSNKPVQSKKTRTALETPFEARRRELAEQEKSLKAAAKRHEQFIVEAPKIAEKIQKEQRERFIRNAAHVDSRGGVRGEFRLPDNRYLEADGAVLPRTRRRHRQQGKWMFFLLVAGLVVAACWAWHMLVTPSF